MKEPRGKEPGGKEPRGTESGVTAAVVTGAGGPPGIRVSVVSPGAFPAEAGQIYDDPAAYSQHVLDQQSLKRRGTPDELAAVVSFLAGPDASFVTGQTIELNGGRVMS